jgi:phosphatidylglycerophosphate synthase
MRFGMPGNVTPDPQRRPIAARERAWAQAVARVLIAARVSPNAISLAGLLFAIGAGLSLWSTGQTAGVARVAGFLAAAALIQLRLLCNMFDGMVAIGSGRQSPYGELYNDMPDRPADLAILLGAGYSLSAIPYGRELGWVAGTLAVLTAYVRVLGGSMGLRQRFTGPMAKPHRMAVMTVACVLSTLEPLVGWRGQTIALALVVVTAGAAWTIARRTSAIVAETKSK